MEKPPAQEHTNTATRVAGFILSRLRGGAWAELGDVYAEANGYLAAEHPLSAREAVGPTHHFLGAEFRDEDQILHRYRSHN